MNLAGAWLVLLRREGEANDDKSTIWRSILRATDAA